MCGGNGPATGRGCVVGNGPATGRQRVGNGPATGRQRVGNGPATGRQRAGNGSATGRQRAGNGPGRWAAIGARPAKFIWGPTGRPADPAPTGRVHSQLQPRHQTTGILINSQLQFLQTSAWPETVASEIPRHDRDTTATRPRQVSGSPGLPGIEGTTAPTGNSSGPLSRINECLYPRGIPGNHC